MSNLGAGRTQPDKILADSLNQLMTLRKDQHRRLENFAPRLGQLIFGKKYILPNYRQAHYYPQDWSNLIYSGALLDPMMIGALEDDVVNATFCNAMRALECGRPQLWLERELAEAFMRSVLPEDMRTEDIKWRWPGLRIHLPKSILRVAPKEGVKEHNLMFMDLCCMPMRQKIAAPEPYASELRMLAQKSGWPQPREVYATLTVYAQSALMITGNLDGHNIVTLRADEFAQGDFMTYGVVKAFNDLTLGKIARVTGTGQHLETPYAPTPNDDRFCERMLHLGLNVLLYLGSMPLEYEVETILRKAKMEGKHAIPALLRAKFVGQSQLRAQPAHSAEPAHPTGRHLPAHWKCGHWKRQVYGPKGAERKLIWIQPYQTYGEKETLTTE